MSKDIRMHDLSGRPPLNPAAVRTLQRQHQIIAARVEVAHLEDLGQALVTQRAIEHHAELARKVRAAVDEDILNLGAVNLLARYEAGAGNRIDRFS